MARRAVVHPLRVSVAAQVQRDVIRHRGNLPRLLENRVRPLRSRVALQDGTVKVGALDDVPEDGASRSLERHR